MYHVADDDVGILSEMTYKLLYYFSFPFILHICIYFKYTLTKETIITINPCHNHHHFDTVRYKHIWCILRFISSLAQNRPGLTTKIPFISYLIYVSCIIYVQIAYVWFGPVSSCQENLTCAPIYNITVFIILSCFRIKIQVKKQFKQVIHTDTFQKVYNNFISWN